MLTRVLPGVVPVLVRHAALRLPGVALALAGLGFLGLGAQAPTPEWGLVLAEALPYIERVLWAVARQTFLIPRAADCRLPKILLPGTPHQNFGTPVMAMRRFHHCSM